MRKQIEIRRILIVIFVVIALSSVSCLKKPERIVIHPNQLGQEIGGGKRAMKTYLEGPLLMLIQGSAIDYVTIEQLKAADGVYKKHAADGLRVLFLSSGDSSGAKTAEIKNNGMYEFDFFIEDDHFSKIFGFQKMLPSIRFIDSRGNVLLHYTAFTEEKTLSADAERLLKQEKEKNR